MDIEIRNYVDTDAGIYYFRNLINNKYYIGQAINIRRRLGHHVSNVLCNRYDAALYKALHKYGFENFEFGILKRFDEDIPKCILDFWEKYYIQYYNSYGATGYNQTLGGDAGVLGLKMTEEQRQKVKEYSTIIANDGRNKIFCYIIDTNTIVKATSLPLLSSVFNIKFHTGDLRNLVSRHKYILARDLETLNKKIEGYNNSIKEVSTRKSSRKKAVGRTKISEEAIQDILNGMPQKDWITKYNLCKASYSHHKSSLVKKGLLEYTRVYKCKVDKETLEEYLKEHSKQEAAAHFEVGLRRIYKYIKAYNINLN